MSDSSKMVESISNNNLAGKSVDACQWMDPWSQICPFQKSHRQMDEFGLRVGLGKQIGQGTVDPRQLAHLYGTKNCALIIDATLLKGL